MSQKLEYVVKGALMLCDKGAAPSQFQPTHGEGVTFGGVTTSNTLDKIPNKHIMPFGACSMQNGNPCMPVPLEWQDTYDVKINHGKTLLFKSCINCSVGGKISFLNSGQVPLPPEELDALLKEHGEPEDGSGWGWWDTAELIPVVGNIIGMVREAKKGNWGMFALNVGFLVVDVLTLGTASIGTTAIKGAVKGGIKAAAKATVKNVAKSTSKMLAKSGIKGLAKGSAKAFAKGVAKATARLGKGKFCVTACFVKGTPIATSEGLKPIEQIQIDDLVWSYDENTGKQALKKVVNTFSNVVDATLQLTLENELIETTAEHPFYTRQGWKKAADLNIDEHVKNKSGKWHQIKAANFIHQQQKVYNFEVADWHTYFVGVYQWLVHNYTCLKTMAKAGQKWAQNLLKGIRFDQLMKKQMTDAVHEVWLKGMKARVDAIVAGKYIISRKATQLADATFDTAKKYIDELAEKYKSGKKIQNPKRAGAEELKGKSILQIPKQNKPIPKEVKDYARKKRVIFDEVKTVTDDILKWW
ncbi:polymorphic toxin-type HINT domain-containing protein [Aquimarina longa]|uniref:polymorphic toxin-type HINT domain-containing protein n=1 Tax=Aquimarina longa TaxID=1080221 RepID=UPI00078228FE|nr:polymorphic toxin-type HINT domain-containing protein [Aquimarina longa]